MTLAKTLAAATAIAFNLPRPHADLAALARAHLGEVGVRPRKIEASWGR